METELPKPPVLLWQGSKNIKHATKTFTMEEINLIFETLRNNKEDYWQKKGYKNWGEFYKERDICILAFIYFEALRPKEACGIKFNDIDFNRKEIFISGKNNKTGKDRVTKLSKLLLPYLEKYLSYPKRFWRNSEYLFPSFSTSSKHVSPSTLKFIMREKALKKCGLYEKAVNSSVSGTRLYSLRKSRASHLLEQSKDIFLVANTLGHSDVRTTAAYYIHTGEEYSNYMQKALDGDLNALKTPEIQINNNNFIFQQMNTLIIQQQKQNEIIMKLLEKLLAKDC